MKKNTTINNNNLSKKRIKSNRIDDNVKDPQYKSQYV